MFWVKAFLGGGLGPTGGSFRFVLFVLVRLLNLILVCVSMPHTAEDPNILPLPAANCRTSWQQLCLF